MKLMTQTRRREYFIRHARNFLPHLTLVKIANLMLNVIERKLMISSPRSLPPYIKIEPMPLCQLRCPGCEQNNPHYKEQFRNGTPMSLEDFKRIVDPLSHTLLGISLSNFGEPLLHKDISSLIEYAHRKNIAVSFPTNLSVKLDDTSIERLVRSGLDSLNVSLDGNTKETYEQYRIGGDFSLVLKNVKSIADTKRKFGLKRPRVIWKFIVFDHNKHETGMLRKRYRELGFDDYELVQDYRDGAVKKVNQALNANLRKTRQGCFWLWHTMIIGWNGEVFPCCRPDYFDIGNAIHRNSKEIWRSDAYKALRQGFSSNVSKIHPICRECLGYNKEI
jgi:radical SAM protein with 4Fe4S-binding SPASM domain